MHPQNSLTLIRSSVIAFGGLTGVIIVMVLKLRRRFKL